MSIRSKRVVIAGGSGFLGLALARHLSQLGADVVILSRSRPTIDGNWTFANWNARTLSGWESSLDGAHCLVNLAGRSVDCIKSPDHCDEILRSRIESTRVLGKAMRAISAPPSVWVQMSTAHIYGDPPVLVCDEHSALGFGLAPTVGKAWERELAEAALENQRQVILRTSFVIGNDLGAGAGAMSRLRHVAKLGLGGTIGSGKQGMSWIHELDMNRIFERAITDSTMSGVYVASSPHPVPQHEFMKELRRATGVAIGLPATEWMVRFGARWILNTDPELAIYGRYVVPSRLLKEGFEFRFPDLRPALLHLESSEKLAR